MEDKIDEVEPAEVDENNSQWYEFFEGTPIGDVIEVLSLVVIILAAYELTRVI